MSIDTSKIETIELNKQIYEIEEDNLEFINLDIKIFRYIIRSKPYNGWGKVSKELWERISSKITTDTNLNLYCYIQTPYWQNNNRIVMHNGISKFFSKKLGKANWNFIAQDYIVKRKHILFGGIIKLNQENFSSLSDTLSLYKNGVFFSANESIDSYTNYLLAHCSKTNPKSLSCKIDIPCVINFITSNNQYTILPCAWEETGEYCLDLFEPSLK